MRLKSLFIVVMLFVVMMAQAQSLQEVVYLKNGSVIRGVIIEQVPNESLKIQTADGSIFVYTMDEVARISKEETNKTYIHKSIPFKEYGTKRGYRGFVDLGYSIGVGDWGEGRLEFSTSHGYQFNPYLFIGAGIGINYFDECDCWAVPFFVHFRVSLPCHPICHPFIDLKVGWAVLSDDISKDGFYMSPSVGCRFAINSMCGISVSVGYSMQSFQEDTSHSCGKDCYSYGMEYKNHGAISLKVGFDF